eukprot:COSAG06_NODE_5036_length_3770_cov_13.868973_6_plen_204_part_00
MCDERLFLEFSLCLSRACLGKMFVLIHKWLKKAHLNATHTRSTTNQVTAPRKRLLLPRQSPDAASNRKKRASFLFETDTFVSCACPRQGQAKSDPCDHADIWADRTNGGAEKRPLKLNRPFSFNSQFLIRMNTPRHFCQDRLGTTVFAETGSARTAGVVCTCRSAWRFTERASTSTTRKGTCTTVSTAVRNRNQQPPPFRFEG